MNREKFTPRPYQTRVCQELYGELPQIRKLVGLGMGMGKTVICLSLFWRLIREGKLDSMLVVAPKRVAEAGWSDEAAKWNHLEGMRVNVMVGTAEQRAQNLVKGAHVYCINYDALQWLYDVSRKFETLWFRAIVFDESTYIKTETSGRTQLCYELVRQLKPDHVLTLSGTCVPRDFIDLYPQVSTLDGGAALGATMTAYKNRYGERKYVTDKRTKVIIPRGRHDEIINRTRHLVIQLKLEDYVKMPKLFEHTIEYDMPPKAMRVYREVENKIKSLGMTLDTLIEQVANEKVQRDDISQDEPGSLYALLCQITAGVCYIKEELYSPETLAILKSKLGEASNGRIVVNFHKAMLDRLLTIIDQIGENEKIWLNYKFISSRDLLMDGLAKRFGKQAVATIRSTTSATDFAYIKNRWIHDPELRYLFVHPRSAGHGLDGFQKAGCRYIVSCGIEESVDSDHQCLHRVYRPGADLEKPITRIRLISSGTHDRMLLARVQEKTQDMKDAIAGWADEK